MEQILPGLGSEPLAPDTEGAAPLADATSSVATTAAEQMAAFEPTWWPSDQVLLILNWVHENAGLPCYAYAIAATTIAVRVALFPVFVSGQRNSSRMAHMQPELKVMKDELDKMGSKIDQAAQIRYQQQTVALFRKYDCNPLKSLAAPLVSAPMFMSMFFGLRQAPEHFPALLQDGGLLWFPDLTAADPYCILPLLSAASFLGMTEVGKEQMMANDPAKGRIFVNVFRALAVAMVPLTMNFNTGVFVYWTANNSFSLMQTVLLKQPAVKKYLGIWDPPKPIPGQEPKSIFDEMQKLVNKNKEKEQPNAWQEDRVKAHNEIIEQQKKVKQKLMERESQSALGRHKK